MWVWTSMIGMAGVLVRGPNVGAVEVGAELARPRRPKAASSALAALPRGGAEQARPLHLRHRRVRASADRRGVEQPPGAHGGGGVAAGRAPRRGVSPGGARDSLPRCAWDA